MHGSKYGVSYLILLRYCFSHIWDCNKNRKKFPLIFDKYSINIKKTVVKRIIIISIFQVIYKNSRWDPMAHECINNLIYDFAI